MDKHDEIVLEIRSNVLKLLMTFKTFINTMQNVGKIYLCYLLMNRVKEMKTNVLKFIKLPKSFY